MLQDIMPGTEEKLMEGPTAAYVGIDPTADSLHIGHLVSIMILKHFQNCGHKPFALIGGATGMIGDPSMKSQERNLLDEETLAHNVACIRKQACQQLRLDEGILFHRLHQGHRQAHHCQLHDGQGFCQEETFVRVPRRNVIHRIHLPAPPGLRLPLAL